MRGRAPGAAAAQPDPDAEEDQPARRTSPPGSRTSSCDRYGTGNAFAGGLKIRTTLDLELQKAAEQAIATRLGGIGPSSALVAIDNDTGGIRAMVGGSDFEQRPFNLATQGRRQPGSVVQAVHADRGAREGHLPRPHVRLEPEDAVGAARRLQGRELRGPLQRRHLAGDGHDGVGQLRLRGGRLQARRHARGREGGEGDGDPHARVPQPGDGARRTEAGRDPARDGQVLRDARRRRATSCPDRSRRTTAGP